MDKQNIAIREATEADVATIVALNQLLFIEDGGTRDPFINVNWPQEEGEAYFLNQHLRRERSVGLLAEQDGEAVGYLIGYVKEAYSLRPIKTADLESVYVKKAFRSQQVGQQLVEAFFTWAKERGAQRISVTAYATNERAIAFYQRMGFAPKNVTLEAGV